MKKFGIDNSKNDSKDISYEIYGDRFRIDQTLYEYLIEFLLVFASPKSKELFYSKGAMSFHDNLDDLTYYAERKMGLKRFIFYNASKKDTSIPADKEAYDNMMKALKDKMDFNESESDVYLSYFQDLLRGYSVVLKKRSWCAQQTLPICPELIFCEAMPNLKGRKAANISGDSIKVDSEFDFSKRAFLARGGEIYYLHVLQALMNKKADKKKELEFLLEDLLTKQSKNISLIARFIQDTWVEFLKPSSIEKNKLYQELKLAWIPDDAYIKAGEYTVDELINYLSASIQQIKKIELLAEGVMLQCLRLLHMGTKRITNTPLNPWIVDMSNGESQDIKKLSAKSFRAVQEDFKHAINEVARQKQFSGEDQVKKVREAQKHSLDIFRTKGKEIRCIIPVSGSFERFTLSENVLRFLVLAIIPPGEKMTLDTFMDQLYDHYGIVISPKQYRRTLNSSADNAKITIGNVLEDNVMYFQSYLESIGCLKELSDATSIVINSYNSVERRDS